MARTSSQAAATSTERLTSSISQPLRAWRGFSRFTWEDSELCIGNEDELLKVLRCYLDDIITQSAPFGKYGCRGLTDAVAQKEYLVPVMQDVRSQSLEELQEQLAAWEQPR